MPQEVHRLGRRLADSPFRPLTVMVDRRLGVCEPAGNHGGIAHEAIDAGYEGEPPYRVAADGPRGLSTPEPRTRGTAPWTPEDRPDDGKTVSESGRRLRNSDRLLETQRRKNDIN